MDSRQVRYGFQLILVYVACAPWQTRVVLTDRNSLLNHPQLNKTSTDESFKNQYPKCYNDLLQPQQQHLVLFFSNSKYTRGAVNQQIMLRVNVFFCKRKLICISTMVVLEAFASKAVRKLAMVFLWLTMNTHPITRSGLEVDSHCCPG